MGYGTGISSHDWDTFTTTKTAGKSTAHVFSSRTLKESLDPSKFTIRESCDSTINPNSLPIIIGLDVTGSMGMIPDYFARTGLPALFKEIYDRKPGGDDPHVAFAGIGDVHCDHSPLQMSQFENSIVLADQLIDLHLEGGGGANDSESYTALWYLAGMKTKIDCFPKRGKKGFLFTIGDEKVPPGLTADHLTKIFGPGQYTDWTTEQLLEVASKYYHVFHVVVLEGSHCRYNSDDVLQGWRNVLGQHVLPLSDYKKLSEVIVSTIETINGKDAATVAKSWSGDTSVVVARALSGLTAGSTVAKNHEVVEF